ncbi:MAG: hypothetical protein CJD30_03535 [Sulfuricurvum sp. PD_MW2]|uniref:hypothetical protein n=1 Tax=Sulfuricurvum sp. PD_MW2 TaxID=2027917 RepID=UPI000C05FD6E|nr:hypothetical protein [Sulfuricurvum sp. PD_MW2]PHM18045.1 MAG: hypothetical protein CJD30_03535 [Sulfuricurvum sp. PD_MW2]
MEILTKYPVLIMIDGVGFNLVLHELNSTQQKEMDELASAIEAVNENAQRVASIINDIETNQALIECVGFIEKAKLLWENKDLKKELIDLQKKIKEANPEKMLSSSLMRRLELTLDGEDKAAFMSEIRSKNIDPKKIISAIGEQIAELQKKK